MVRRMMKMAAVAPVTALLLCCSFFASADSTDSCSHYATTNEDFIVPLNHELQKSERLSWKHDASKIYDSIRDRAMKRKDIFANGSLKLTKVNKSSEGLYTPEVFTLNGEAVPKLQTIHLCVLDRVPKPTVTITCPKPTSVKVTCTVKDPKGIQFAWFKNDKPSEKKEKDSILVFKAEDVETVSFRCEVSNKASSQKSDPVTQSCFSSGITFPEELFGINIWIIVGGGAGVVVLLILIVIICCIHNRRKKRVQLKDEEELRLGWTNPNQQQQQQHHHHQHNHPPNQHHHHHHQQQQQPAGHTGPRQPRKKQQHNTRPRAPDPNGQPEPSPRRQGLSLPKVPDSVDDEQPPPLPQPRKKGPKTQRV
ncbi:uncharacterized protein LOC104931475 isoform X2 [Larimichthys crocea]|nr:uncharacterized protein LOC104931475 isoform X2 [Larimichthys crocea]